MSAKMAALVAVYSALGACSVFEPCRTAQCAEDARISAEVQKRVDAHAALRVPGVDVQTGDRVVYLRGLVDTSLERDEAESIARQVPGVSDVVNMLGISGQRP